MKTSLYHRRLASCLLFVFVYQLLFPIASYALTTGPSTPEVMQFQPTGVTENVDPFTGDFQYAIPLGQVGDYPLSLSYESGRSMDEEASMVGLGWSLNTGVISRSVRGIPDDFDGDAVEKKTNVLPNRTYGISAGIGFELAGLPKIKSLKPEIGVTMGISWNNYKGFNIEPSLDLAVSAGDKAKLPYTANLGLSLSDADGVEVTPSVSFAKKRAKDDPSKYNKLNLGMGFSSRHGLKAITLTAQKVTPRIIEKSHFDRSAGVSGSIPLSLNTYTPTGDLEFENLSIGGTFKPSAAIASADPNLDIKGYFSRQKLRNKTKTQSAYGYFNLQKGMSNPDALMDFNREKDGGFSANTPVLPLTTLTYDLFCINAQGLGGMFRAHRNEAGFVFNPAGYHPSFNGQVGVEAGPGNTAKFGIDLTVNVAKSVSGVWANQNDALNRLLFSAVTEGSHRENVYFKQAGELTVSHNPTFYEIIGKEKAVRIATNRNEAFNKLEGENFSQILDNPVRKENREPRNTAISYLTVGEIKKLKQYRTLSPNVASPITKKDHHIGEITITKPDGTRYVFGLAAYNTTQKEVTFAVEGLTKNAQGLITYSSGDNSDSNTKGLDNFYQSSTTPAYAYAYHLTEILSPDYVDVTNNGATPDDLGTFTRFDYTPNLNNLNFNWRTPLGENTANFTEGLRTNLTDDRANYVYGEKEIYTLSTIRTRTQKAVFTYAPRFDGQGVADENGKVVGGTKLQRLKQIDFYAADGCFFPTTNPPLLKTVVLGHDYTLCTNVPNNLTGSVNGKLTLKSVTTTFQDSKKGNLSPYKFTYSTENPSYNIQESDRWSMYKKNPTAIGNDVFPYTEQDSTKAAKNARSWQLERIDLPTGGIIKVDYESDDYQYVQNQRAGEMFDVVGATNDYDFANNIPANNNLYSRNTATTPPSNNLYLKVKLKQPITGANKEDFFIKNYLSELPDNLMYFRFSVNVNEAALNYEDVSGYAKIEPAASKVSTAGDFAFIKLKSVTLRDKRGYHINPIAKAAINFSKLNTPYFIYGTLPPGVPLSTADILDKLTGITLIEKLLNAFHEQSRLIDDGFGQEFQTDRSWVRLMNPNGKKLGGSSRVKRIKISDNWQAMQANEPTWEYGQEYSYRLKDGTSSGVAAYEPMIGADENSLRQPLTLAEGDRKEQRYLSPDDDYYLEMPVGEMFYPSPNVGYSHVEVKNLQYQAVKNHATGKIVHEFYTSRDFPVISTYTDLKCPQEKSKYNRKILKNPLFHNATASQGFAVEINDMEGKPSSQKVYDEAGNLISGIDYHYSTDMRNRTERRLRNTADVVDKTGSIEAADIGMTCDVVADFREESTKSARIGAQTNADAFVLGALPGVMPSVWPTAMVEKTRFRSATFTKLIQRTGILTETIAYDLGSKISTKNRLFDKETGEVVLTETVNEYDDPVFNFTYPAHWAYEGMSMAYRNLGFTSKNITDFTEGDEIDAKGLTNRLWKFNGVWKNELGATQSFSSSTVFKTIRPINRNQQSLPIGSIITKATPIRFINGRQKLVFDANTRILDAAAQEYQDNWKAFCCANAETPPVLNPFMTGEAGNWRPVRSWAYLTNRLPNNLATVDVREGGVYAAFSPFWQFYIKGVAKNPQDWQWKTEITKYDTRGNERENQDALTRFSAALYGYDGTLPIGVAANAALRQIGFDGFEDNNPLCNSPSRFRFIRVNRTGATAHSGKFSVSIVGNTALNLTTSACQNVSNTISCQNCMAEFDPIDRSSTPTKRSFVLNFWAKIGNATPTEFDYKNIAAEIKVNNTSIILPAPTKTKIIEGWQQFEYIFDMPSSSTPTATFSLDIKNSNPSRAVFIDDIRLQPFNSGFKTYVYDATNLRLMAELDDRNFASFYEYDSEGQLTRKKKETEQGIVTLQESKTHIRN